MRFISFWPSGCLSSRCVCVHSYTTPLFHLLQDELTVCLGQQGYKFAASHAIAVFVSLLSLSISGAVFRDTPLPTSMLTTILMPMPTATPHATEEPYRSARGSLQEPPATAGTDQAAWLRARMTPTPAASSATEEHDQVGAKDERRARLRLEAVPEACGGSGRGTAACKECWWWSLCRFVIRQNPGRRALG